MRHGAAVWAFRGLVLMTGLPACSALFAPPDECTKGTERCNGQVVEECETCSDFGCNAHWMSRGSCDACYQITPYIARCSPPDAPDPRCAGRFEYCDGRTIVPCSGGYAVGQYDPRASACRESASEAFCEPTGTDGGSDAGDAAEAGATARDR